MSTDKTTHGTRPPWGVKTPEMGLRENTHLSLLMDQFVRDRERTRVGLFGRVQYCGEPTSMRINRILICIVWRPPRVNGCVLRRA
jgi:hypothetical protein